MTGPDSGAHRTVRDYSKVTNERKRPGSGLGGDATGNLGTATRARYYAGNQCRVDCHVCVFLWCDYALVPVAHAGRRCSVRRRNRGVYRGERGMSANRRDFIKFVVAGAVTAGCPIDLSLVAAQTSDAEKKRSADVDGEDNRICHQVRDK